MPDPIPNNDPANTGTGQPDPAGNADPKERLFTQDEVNAIVAKRVKETRGTQRQTAPSDSPKPGTKADAMAELEAYKAEVESMRMRQRFDRLALKAGLDDDQADDLFELFQAQKPDDAAAWLEQKAKRFGFAKANTTPPKDQTTASDKAKTGATTPPISDKGTAAPGVRDYEQISLERPNELTADDIARIQEKEGFHKANLQIRDRVNAYLRTVKPVPDRKRSNQ